ncbi:MAG: RluA family pseudouridine synthase, partial [Treponema sp.]|nr:RluA family pseudouridine synthase [Treponema sp.]
MFPPFPEDEAYRLCKKIAKSLEENEIRIEHTGRISEERAGAGIMIGALICTDKDGKKVNLASLSGTSRKFVSGSPTADSIPDSIQGFIPVPCIVPPEKIDAALEKNDAE